MKTIKINFTKIAGLMGLLLSLSLFNYSYAGFINLLETSQPTMDANQNITFRMRESSGAEVLAQNSAGDRNISVQIALTGLELNGTIADIVSTNLSTYFDLIYSSASSLIIFTQKLVIIPAGTSINVSIPVSTTITNGSISYAVALSKTANSDEVAVAATGLAFGNAQTLTGGGATPPNYSIGMDIASGGNNLGTDPSKVLPLEITVTNNIASADNTGPVVVALAKDSRLALATGCAPANWTKSDNSVAYLFTYANADGSNTFAPDPTKTDSTIVCPVTVTRPTTQSGKLQLNAVLRHGSGDTKTSNDVASIEVTYN